MALVILLAPVVGEIAGEYFEKVSLPQFPDTVTHTIRGDGKQVNSARITVVVDGFTFTGTITGSKLQFTTDGGSTWKDGASDYEEASYDRSNNVLAASVDGMIIMSNNTPDSFNFELLGMGLLVPTMMRAADMTISATECRSIHGYRRVAEVNNGFRIIFSGTAVNITGGTMYLAYWG